MYKNEFLSGLGLSLTQNVIGSTLGGVTAYQLGVKYSKVGGWGLAGMVVLGALIGSVIQSRIELPKF